MKFATIQKNDFVLVPVVVEISFNQSELFFKKERVTDTTKMTFTTESGRRFLKEDGLLTGVVDPCFVGKSAFFRYFQSQAMKEGEFCQQVKRVAIDQTKELEQLTAKIQRLSTLYQSLIFAASYLQAAGISPTIEDIEKIEQLTESIHRKLKKYRQ